MTAYQKVMNQESDIRISLSSIMGHISRQRVRYIQMELRRCATDARIENEGKFWKLLESNGLRLPDRTAESFLVLIKDQRGINVETASRYLKESQRLTRRDSVNALRNSVAEIENGANNIKHDAASLHYKNRPEFRKMEKRMSRDRFRKASRLIANVSSVTGRMRDLISADDHMLPNVIDETDSPNTDVNRGENILEILMENGGGASDHEEVTQGNEPKMDYLTIPHQEPLMLPQTEDPLGPIAEDNTVPILPASKEKTKNSINKEEDTFVITITVEDTEQITDQTSETVPASENSDTAPSVSENLNAKTQNDIDPNPTHEYTPDSDSLNSKVIDIQPEVRHNASETAPDSIVESSCLARDECSNTTEKETPISDAIETEVKLVKDSAQCPAHESECESQHSNATEVDENDKKSIEDSPELPSGSTDSFVTDDGSRDLNLSLSDSDDSETPEANFETKSIADFGGEDVNVGGFRVTMYPPEWYHNREYVDAVESLQTSSQPDLEVEWVYGCDTTHVQSMAALGDEEIVYGSGCVVILYNHARNTQRHYLDHSGPIACIAVHPDNDRIASSQGESALASLEHNSGDLDKIGMDEPCCGRIHVRVWDTTDLTTLYTFGTGTFLSTVRKMQFMNYRNYLLTIEDDVESSLALWDAGCKIQSLRLVPNTDEDSNKNKNKSADNCPRAIAATLSESAEFAIAGRESVGFWRITEMEQSSKNEDLVTVTGPVRGDFVKQFRPRHVTCCVSIQRHGVNYYVTGDTNGTVMVWSEAQREAVAAANHAHECPIGCVVAAKAHVFSSGATDRSVCAFAWGKEEMDRAGKVTLPNNAGKISSLCQVGANLFAATTLHMIATVGLNHPAYVPQIMRPAEEPQSPKRDKDQGLDCVAKGRSVFTQWEKYEVARGDRQKVKCLCATGPIKRRPELSSSRLSSASSRRKLSKSARTRRQPAAPSLRRPAYSARPRTSNANKPRSSVNGRTQTNNAPPSITGAFASPKLRTSDRVLKRERAKSAKIRAPPPLTFEKENHVCKSVFQVQPFPSGASLKTSETQQSFDSDGEACVWTLTSDGWILGCDSATHRVHARYKLPNPGDVASMDCSSTQGLIAVGCCNGVCLLIEIGAENFEMVSETDHVKEGSSTQPIEVVRFSKSGKKLAVCMGNEVIVNVIRDKDIQELDRYASDVNAGSIMSIDWSALRVHGSDLIRCSVLSPEPELRVWSTENYERVDDISTLRNMTWHNDSSPLEFSVKGVWDRYSEIEYISCFATANIKQTSQRDHGDSSRVNEETQYFEEKQFHSMPVPNGVCAVGDVSGSVKIFRYPCIASNALQTAARTFHSAVTGICSYKSKLYAVGNDDRNIVQFNAAQGKEKC